MIRKKELIQISIEIRKLIDEKQKALKLSFIEDTHTYHIKNLQGEMTTKFPSVSTVIKQFYEDFPALEKSLQMCKNNIVEQDMLLNEWRATADYANSKGSRVHYLLEKDLLTQYGSYKDVRKPIFDCDETQIKDSNAMIDAGHNFINLMHRRGAILLDTEMVLGSNTLKYTGQPDKVWVMFNEKGELGFIVTDWKGLPLTTPILTNNGWKTMGTLNEDDKVYDKDGVLVDILNISSIKNKKCLKIIFDNNEEIVSDFEHRWLVYTESNGVKREKVMTTQEIKSYNDNLNKRQSHKILKIGNPKPLVNPKIELPIDPYLLGIWLGDNNSVDAKISQANQSVWEEIKKRGYEISDDLSQGSKITTRTVFGLQHKLSGLGLLFVKHIPEIYILSSYEQRLDLLRGLMDSIGTFNKVRKRFVITTTKKKQVGYYSEIISSLGVKPTIINYNKKFKRGIIKYYNLEFTTSDFNPFLCRNQNILVNPKTNKRLFRNITSIEEVESVPTKCIEVNSPSNTFLCGKTLIVTHNTNKAKNFEVHHYTKPMLPPFEKEMDTALGHYKIQLPLYARLILDMLKGTKYESINLFGCIIVHLTSSGSFKELRVPSTFINNVLEMPPLPRIKEVMIKKENDIIAEELRVGKLNNFDKKEGDDLKWFEKY